MIGKIILTCFEIVFLVLGIMFIVGVWDLTGFSFFDSPMGETGTGWNVALGIFFLLFGLLLFVISLAMGRRVEDEWNEEEDNGKKKKKDKKAKDEDEFEEEQEW